MKQGKRFVVELERTRAKEITGDELRKLFETWEMFRIATKETILLFNDARIGGLFAQEDLEKMQGERDLTIDDILMGATLVSFSGKADESLRGRFEAVRANEAARAPELNTFPATAWTRDDAGKVVEDVTENVEKLGEFISNGMNKDFPECYAIVAGAVPRDMADEGELDSPLTKVEGAGRRFV